MNSLIPKFLLAFAVAAFFAAPSEAVCNPNAWEQCCERAYDDYEDCLSDCASDYCRFGPGHLCELEGYNQCQQYCRDERDDAAGLCQDDPDCDDSETNWQVNLKFPSWCQPGFPGDLSCPFGFNWLDEERELEA